MDGRERSELKDFLVNENVLQVRRRLSVFSFYTQDRVSAKFRGPCPPLNAVMLVELHFHPQTRSALLTADDPAVELSRDPVLIKSFTPRLRGFICFACSRFHRCRRCSLCPSLSLFLLVTNSVKNLHAARRSFVFLCFLICLDLLPFHNLAQRPFARSKSRGIR